MSDETNENGFLKISYIYIYHTYINRDNDEENREMVSSMSWENRIKTGCAVDAIYCSFLEDEDENENIFFSTIFSLGEWLQLQRILFFLFEIMLRHSSISILMTYDFNLNKSIFLSFIFDIFDIVK